MLSKRQFKALLRSRSMTFMQNLHPSKAGKGVESIAWKGRQVFYRAGSGDASIINDVLLRTRGEYWVPQEVNPEVILDIGANIGTATLYFAHRFPDAKIYAFEPVPDNFALLEKNVKGLPNVTVLPIALGSQDGELEIALAYDQNFGSFSFFSDPSLATQKIPVQIRAVAPYFAELGIDRADLIKIDTEGAEYDILTALPVEILGAARWIIGELHGIRDFEALAYLSKWFDIGMKKPVTKNLYMFNAKNKDLALTR